MTLKLHNTLTGEIDNFKPINDSRVTLYTCGPTVYDYPHVGNWASFLYWDILVRTLIANGYNVERVMNITDVGHLVSDADEGEDKLEKGAKREGKTAWEVAEFYAEDFMNGMQKLGLILPEHITKATDYIDQQLALVRALKEKGYTYQTSDGIYFDTSKFPHYANFAHLDLAAQKAGARVEQNDEKRQPWDFALWKFTLAGQKRDMEWETPEDLIEELKSNDDSTKRHSGVASVDFLETELSEAPVTPAKPGLRAGDGDNDQNGAEPDDATEKATSGDHTPIMGFPGWHLECSAMAMDILGETIDIHTGGIDHIPVHHTNEIAQSEAATGKQFAHYWLHNNHLKIDGGKISKSLGNGYTLQDIADRGFSALDLRMFVLQSQFTSEGNFTFENLEAAKNRLNNWRNYAALRHQTMDSLNNNNDENFEKLLSAGANVKAALNDNLNTPLALSITDDAFDSLDDQPLQDINRHALMDLLTVVDELLGLQLLDSTPDISDQQKNLITEREQARATKNWQLSDTIRDNLESTGITVRDTKFGPIWEYR